MNSEFEVSHYQAMTLFQEGRYDEAERVFLQLLTHRPQGFADIYNKLGFIYQWRGELQKAADFFQKALNLNPKYTEAALNLAVTYNDMGLYDEAVETFNRAASVVKAQPRSLDPYIRGRLANEHARLGDLYYALGLYEEALDEYRKALTLRPNLVDIMTKIGITLRDQVADSPLMSKSARYSAMRLCRQKLPWAPPVGRIRTFVENRSMRTVMWASRRSVFFQSAGPHRVGFGVDRIYEYLHIRACPVSHFGGSGRRAPTFARSHGMHVDS